MSIVSKYNRIAPIYELIDLPLEYFFFRKWRKEALSNLSGKVLEVGVGTGRNLKFYSLRCSVTGIDISEKMLEKARIKARGMRNITLLLVDAEQLRFPDNNFDYIVTTFTLCSIPDPLRALMEMRRVLKPSGELIAIEYVRSSNLLIAWFEDLLNPVTCSLIGDSMNRKTIDIIKEAGFIVSNVENLVMGSFFRQLGQNHKIMKCTESSLKISFSISIGLSKVSISSEADTKDSPCKLRSNSKKKWITNYQLIAVGKAHMPDYSFLLLQT